MRQTPNRIDMEILIYTGVPLLIVLTGIVLLHDPRMTPGRGRYTRSCARQAEYNYDDCPDQLTIDLIGEASYREMVNRVESVMMKHDPDSCVTFDLTTSNNSNTEAVNELHDILPGMPLELTGYMEADIPCVGVYSQGIRIGSLMLESASAFLELARKYPITGTYVARQDCYKEYNRLDLGIIVYYHRITDRPGHALSMIRNYLISLKPKSDSHTIDIFQN